MLLFSYWVNRYHAIYRIYNSARTYLLLFLLYSAIFCQFYHILPTTAIYGQCAAMYGNMPSAATCNVLPYSARVGLYGVGGMRQERVVVCKVLWGGPVTISNCRLTPFRASKIRSIYFQCLARLLLYTKILLI